MMKIKLLFYKAWLCFCLFGLLGLASCATSKPVVSSVSDGWIMNVLLDKGYKLEVLEGNELIIIPVDNGTEANTSYAIFFKPTDGFRLEGMKSRLLASGVMKAEVIRL